jgi:hypothetical protein
MRANRKMNFEIKFYNASDNCVKKIGEESILKIIVNDQCYYIKPDADLKDLKIPGGRIGLYLNAKEIYSAKIIPTESAFLPVNKPFILLPKGEFDESSEGFCVMFFGDSSKLYKVFNKRLIKHLKRKGIKILSN